MHSIRVKITAITIAAILTSVLSVFAAYSFTIQSENDRNSVNIMNLMAENTGYSLARYIESIEQSLEVAANIACDSLDAVTLVELGAAGTQSAAMERTEEQTASLNAYLHEYSDQVQQSFRSIAGHTNGVITYYYCFVPELSDMEHGFFYSKLGKTGFEKQEPLDSRGLDPEDIEHTAWYYTPIQKGVPSWVGPYTSQSLGEMWIISYVTPIYKAGTLIGVIGMDIPYDTLADQIRSIRVFDTGFACLMNSEGQIIYHPTMEIGQKPDMEVFSLDSDLFSKQSSEDTLIRYEVDGVERQMSFTTLANGMKLIITAPIREISASWANLTRIIAIATILVVAFFVALVLFVLRIITKPLRELTEASRQLAAGNYDVELKYTGKDEVGTLTGAFTRMRDQIELSIEDLNRQILTDRLTGLPNMRYFFKLAEAERDQIASEGGSPVFLFFNLMGMKHFNRQYSFDEGDKLICEVARLLKNRYGENRVSRISQDYFAAVATEDGVTEGLNEFFRDCSEANEGRSLPISVGIYPNRIETVSASLACDRAKYACDMNRGAYISGYTFFNSSMLYDLENVRYIISHLDQAIEEKWIKVYYQPIIRAANGMICDEEALSRWVDPVKGFLPPNRFIPILENARLIYKLDLYVLDQILEKLKSQKAANMHLVPQSLNLSRSDFESCDIVEEIRSRMDAAGVPRKLLTIEITESIVGSDFDFMKEQIQRFQKLGFQVWMDDFGSGYSALDVLQEIHFDLIKFDMRFLRRLGDGNDSKVILTELSRMAIGLGIETIAEGVERKDQVEFLREVGCTKLQGFYYSKAIPMEEIIEKSLKGDRIDYENQEETPYFTAIGRINLYDLSDAASDSRENIRRFFDTVPMAVIEADDSCMQITRCNSSYREFMASAFGESEIELSRKIDLSLLKNGTAAPFAKAIEQCREEGTCVFVQEEIKDGGTIHAIVKYIASNPVTGRYSCIVGILGLFERGSDIIEAFNP